MTPVRAKTTKKRPGSAYRPASPSPAGRGGGAFNEDGTLAVADCTFRANVAMGANGGDGFGGGIYVSGGTVTVSDCRITGNEADGSAGGAGGADGQGVSGGLYNAAGAVRVHGTRINHNHASTSDENVFGDIEYF